MKPSFSSLSRHIAQNEWYQKSFEGSLHALYQWPALIAEQKKDSFFNVRFHEVWIIVHGKRVEYFWNKQDLLTIRKWFIAHISRDHHFAKNIVGRWVGTMAPIKKTFRALEKINFKRLSATELTALHKTFFSQYLKGPALAVLNEGFSLDAEIWLQDLLRAFLKKRGDEEKTHEYFLALTRATRPSFIQEAVLAKKKGMSPRDLAKNFFWIHFNYLLTNPLPLSYFKTMKVGSLPDFRAVAREKKQLIKALQLPKNLVQLFEAADLFTWWQDQRKKYALLVTYWQYEFLKEASRRAGISFEQARASLPTEFSLFIKKDKAYVRELDKRIDPLMVYTDDHGDHVYAGTAVGRLLKKMTRHIKPGAEVRGTPTCYGVARGKVVVLMGVADMKRVAPGDILVTSMTRPEYTPVIHKAGAIVTDEGGIASHASIISREMKKPCIIGTKIATKVLKDGDYVEVDANTGIVTKR